MKLSIFETPELTAECPPIKVVDLKDFYPENVLGLGRNKSNDVIIDNQSVSRNHLKIVIHPGGLLISDLDIRNGTWLNNFFQLKLHKLRAIKTVPMLPGQIMKLGDVWLRLDLDSTDVPEPALKISIVVTKPDDLQKKREAALPEPALEPAKTNLDEANEVVKVYPKQKNFIVLLWLYLGIITVAEYITAAINPQVGLLIHVSLLLWLLWQGVSGGEKSQRDLLLSLTIAPLIRLLSVSLPLISLPQLSWYPLVAVPLLLSTFLIVRQIGLSRRALGLSLGWLPLQLTIWGGGFGLGAIEYIILRPAPLIKTFSIDSLLLPSLNLIVFTGFNEEIIFRGLLMATTLPILKRWSPLYVSLLFAVLHIGYLSITDVIFVFFAGLIFAYIVFWGGSILGVTLAHGFANITLFLIMPYLTQQTDQSGFLFNSLTWLIWGSSAMGMLSFAIMGLTGRYRLLKD